MARPSESPERCTGDRLFVSGRQAVGGHDHWGRDTTAALCSMSQPGPPIVAHGTDERDERFTARSEAVASVTTIAFDAANQSGSFELLEARGESLWADPANGALELAESIESARQIPENQWSPAVTEDGRGASERTSFWR
jgi:hypothetical protein